MPFILTVTAPPPAAGFDDGLAELLLHICCLHLLRLAEHFLNFVRIHMRFLLPCRSSTSVIAPLGLAA